MIARRTTRTALVTVAVAGLASGCLSSGSDSGQTAAERSRSRRKSRSCSVSAVTRPQASLPRSFAKANGLTIKYTQSDSFDTLIRPVAGNDLPDIALFPQPVC